MPDFLYLDEDRIDPLYRQNPFGVQQNPGGLQPLAAPAPPRPLAPLGGAGRPGPRFPTFDQATTDSMLGQLGEGALGTLQYVAETLDKPGAAVRGLLAGRPGQLANLIPFSDTLGITNARDRTSGRDLLEQYGVIEQNKYGFNPLSDPGDALGDAAGLAAEIALDPLFWVTAPSRTLTPAGQAAAARGRMASGVMNELDDAGRFIARAPSTADLAGRATAEGLLAPTQASRIAAGQAGLTGVWNPFGQDLILGTGPRSQRFAETVLDPLTRAIKYNPVTRGLRSTFDKSVDTTSAEVLQRVGEETGVPLKQAAEIRVGQKAHPFLHQVETEGLVGEVAERGARMAGEGVLREQHVQALEVALASPNPAEAIRHLVETDATIAHLFPQAPGIEDAIMRVLPDELVQQTQIAVKSARLGSAMGADMRQYLEQFDRWGLDIQDLIDSKIQFFARHHYGSANEARTMASVFDDYMRGFIDTWSRHQFLKDIPFGTVSINDMVRDARISGPGRMIDNLDDAADYIATRYLGMSRLDADTPARFAIDGLTGGPIASEVAWHGGRTVADQAYQIAHWLAGLPDQYAAQQLNMFNAHPVVDYLLYTQKAERGLSLSQIVHSMVSRAAVEAPAPIQGPSAGVTVENFLESLAGLGLDVSEGGKALSSMARSIGQVRGAPAANVSLGQFRLDPVQAGEIRRFIESWSDKTVHSAILDMADHYQNLFKGGTTLPWPAFHSRNLVSGMFYNFTSGHGANPKDMDDAFSIMTGRPARYLGEIRGPRGEVYDTARMTALAEGAGAYRARSFGSEIVGTSGMGRVTQEAIDPNNIPEMARTMFHTGDQAISPSAFVPNPDYVRATQRVPANFRVAADLPDEVGGLTVRLTDQGRAVGDVQFGFPRGETATAQRMFPQIVNETDDVRRIHQVFLDPQYRGQGLGAHMLMGAMDQPGATWFYNSQSAPDLSDLLTSLRDKGLVELHWQSGVGPGRGMDGGIFLVRPTPAGRLAYRQAAGLMPTPASGPAIAQQSLERTGEGARLTRGAPPESFRVTERTPREVLLNRPLRRLTEVPESTLSDDAGQLVRWADLAERRIAPVLSAGAEVGQNVEDFLRLSHFIGAMRNGLSPVEAALSVKKWHFDYRPEAFTWAERNVLKRLVPFYSFMSRNLKLVASELMQDPGGRLAQSIRAASQPNIDRPGLVPGYITERAAIPIGQEQEGGRQKYITSLGLPFEQAFDIIQFEPTTSQTIRRTTEGLLAQMRPEIKGPLEQLANRNFYFGRPLDAQKTLTGNQPLDQLLYNSPIARFVSSGRQLADPAKTPLDHVLNFTTGLKISDVPIDAARRENEDVLRGILREDPRVRNFENLYIPPENLEGLSPETVLLMRLYGSVQAQRRKQAAERRRQEALAGASQP